MTAAIEQRKACLVETVRSQSLEDIEQKTFEEIQAYIGLGLFSTDEVEQIFSSFFDAWESAPKKAAASNPCRYYNTQNPELLKCAVNPSGDCATCREWRRVPPATPERCKTIRW